MGVAASFANLAHQVIEVKPGSPAAKSGLCAGEDYVIVFDGYLLAQLSPEEIFFAVMKAEDKDVEALVYNAVQNCTRTITLHPSKGWLVNNMTLDDTRLSTKKNLLGVTILLKPCAGFHSNTNNRCPPIADLLLVHNNKRAQMSLATSPYSSIALESTHSSKMHDSSSTLPIQFLENDENVCFDDNPLRSPSVMC